METQIVKTKRIEHAIQQRNVRLHRRRLREKTHRRIDKFKTLLTPEATKIQHLSTNMNTATTSIEDTIEKSFSSDEQHSSQSNYDEAGDNPDEDSRYTVDEPCHILSNADYFTEISETSTISSEECESIIDYDRRNDDLIERRLHEHTNASMHDCCQQLLSFLRTANVNKSHSSSLLKIIKSLLPTPNNMPSSMEDVFDILGVQNLFVKRKVCLLCEQELENGGKLCVTCESMDIKNVATIYDVDVEHVMKTLLERLSSDIDAYKKNISDNDDSKKMNDIPFCDQYRRLLDQNRSQCLISLLLHLDGVGLTKSTRLKLWLLSGSFVELPPSLRYRRHNMVLLSIWVGYIEPHPDVWLKSIVNELKYLKTKELTVKNIEFRLKIYGVTGDCPALSKILNFIGHNGYDCCWFCYLHGQHIQGKRQYIYQQPIVLRTSQRYLKESIDAHRLNTRINGHLGKSIIQDLVDVPLPDSIVIDYLHVTLLGHVKTILIDIYKQLTPLQRKDFDDQLRKQQLPHFFARKVRPFTELAYFKASEFKNIFFYCLLPNLQTLLPLEKLTHLALFVCSIRLLHGQSQFGNQTSTIANDLFSKFYEDHTHFYSNQQNFVLHLHIHFSKMYNNHGALSNIGCFGQEDLIGYVSSNRHGTCHFGELITHYYTIDFHLHNKNTTKKLHDGPKDPSVQPADYYDDTNMFHSRLCYGCNRLNDCLIVYRRYIIREQMFHSLIYNRSKKSVSYFVQYLSNNEVNGRRFGAIQFFFTYNGEGYAVIQHYPLRHSYSDCFKRSKYYNLLQEPLDCFFFIVEKQFEERDLVHVDCIVNHCITIEMAESLFVTPISAYDEHD